MSSNPDQHDPTNRTCPWNDPETFENPATAGLPCSCRCHVLPSPRSPLPPMVGMETDGVGWSFSEILHIDGKLGELVQTEPRLFAVCNVLFEVIRSAKKDASPATGCLQIFLLFSRSHEMMAWVNQKCDDFVREHRRRPLEEKFVTKVGG